MTYRLNLDTYLIVFRGTDDSIIGWKEDFHMTYMKEIPAQKHALEYLEDFFKQYTKQIKWQPYFTHNSLDGLNL